MKKRIAFILAAVLLAMLPGCAEATTLNPDKPVTLTMWHVYGEQADSPMNRLVEEFNRTVGREKGIVLNVTLMSSTAQIGQKLLDAQAQTPGVPAMPDLFFCHNNNAQELGVENLLDWNTLFSQEELEAYVPEFLDDGRVDDHLCVFPVSKSTHLLFVSGSRFDRFAADTGVSYDDLATWEGFFQVAAQYYDWSGGQPFCALDYLIRAVELNAMARGGSDFYTADGWYDFENPALHHAWMALADSYAQGHILVSDLYSNTQVMTGEVVAGLGSSASILYYNDTVTYPDNTSEPMDLRVLPMPGVAGKELLVTQAGAGLCATKTTEQKQEAAGVFARWLTEPERNLEFCVGTGYMPVTQEAFSQIEDYPFSSEACRRLYATLNSVNQTATAVREPAFAGYYGRVYQLYDSLRGLQKEIPHRIAAGESSQAIAEETWALFRSIA